SRQYALTESAVFAKPAGFPNVVTDFSEEAILQVYARAAFSTDSLAVLWQCPGGVPTLSFREKLGGVDSSTTLTFDATAHAYWRIRNTAGVNYWETSPDGATWTVRRSKASAVDWSGSVVAL